MPQNKLWTLLKKKLNYSSGTIVQKSQHERVVSNEDDTLFIFNIILSTQMIVLIFPSIMGNKITSTSILSKSIVL